MSSTTARRLGDVGASLKCHPARKVEMTPPAGDTPCAKRHVSQTPAPGCITGSRASVGIRREARLVRRGKPMAAIDPQKRLARCFTPQIPARCSTFWCHPCGCPMISTSLVSRQQRTYSLAACCAMHPSFPQRTWWTGNVPGEHRQAQIDGRGVQRIDAAGQVHSRAFADVETSGLSDQPLGELGIDAPLARVELQPKKLGMHTVT